MVTPQECSYSFILIRQDLDVHKVNLNNKEKIFDNKIIDN